MTRREGKWKASQNQPAANRADVVGGLRELDPTCPMPAIEAGTSPGVRLPCGLEQNRVQGGEKEHEKFRHVDQFADELAYLSDCILNDRNPEPDGEEAWPTCA